MHQQKQQYKSRSLFGILSKSLGNTAQSTKLGWSHPRLIASSHLQAIPSGASIETILLSFNYWFWFSLPRIISTEHKWHNNFIGKVIFRSHKTRRRTQRNSHLNLNFFPRCEAPWHNKPLFFIKSGLVDFIIFFFKLLRSILQLWWGHEATQGSSSLQHDVRSHTAGCLLCSLPKPRLQNCSGRWRLGLLCFSTVPKEISS